jgi:phosphatidylglycerophosphate synthase
VLILALCDWGRDDWHLPWWFAFVVVARDVIIVGGIGILWRRRREVKFVPHWTGKVTTVSQFVALGWVMLGWLNYPPAWTCAVAAFFTAWSTFTYLRQGVNILRGNPPQGV